MPEKIDAAAADATPPVDFNAFPKAVVYELLGPMPGDLQSYDRRSAFRAVEPEAWPEDLEGPEFLYRGLLRLLSTRGGTVEEAKAIRRDLQAGRIRAAVLLPHGPLWDLEPHRFQGDESRRLWWSARPKVWVNKGPRLGGFDGDIYLIAAPQPEAALEPIKANPPPADWWPKLGQSQKEWATNPGVNREAGRRLKAAGVTMTESAKARAMEAMASEAGVAWSAASIEATRRKSR